MESVQPRNEANEPSAEPASQESHRIDNQVSDLESLGLPETWLEEFQEELDALSAGRSKTSFERVQQFMQTPSMEMSARELNDISERFGQISRVAMAIVAHPNCSPATLTNLFVNHHRDIAFAWQLINRSKTRPPEEVVERIEKDHGNYLILKNAQMGPWWQERLCRPIRSETLKQLLDDAGRFLAADDAAVVRRGIRTAEISARARYLHLIDHSPSFDDSSRLVVSGQLEGGPGDWSHQITYRISQKSLCRRIRLDGDSESAARIDLDPLGQAEFRQLFEAEALCVVADLEKMVGWLNKRRRWLGPAGYQAHAA